MEDMHSPPQSYFQHDELGLKHVNRCNESAHTQRERRNLQLPRRILQSPLSILPQDSPHVTGNVFGLRVPMIAGTRTTPSSALAPFIPTLPSSPSSLQSHRHHHHHLQPNVTVEVWVVVKIRVTF